MNELRLAKVHNTQGDFNIEKLLYCTSGDGVLDLIESTIVTMHPELVEVNERIQNKLKKDYRPVQACLSSVLYDEDGIRWFKNRNLWNKYARRKDDYEYIELLDKLRKAYFKIVTAYREGWCMNKEGIVVSNYTSSPTRGYVGESRIPFPEAKDMNPDAFTVIKWFIRLQHLRVNQEIPKGLIKFIEEFEAKKLLEY